MYNIGEFCFFFAFFLHFSQKKWKKCIFVWLVIGVMSDFRVCASFVLPRTSEGRDRTTMSPRNLDMTTVFHRNNNQIPTFVEAELDGFYLTWREERKVPDVSGYKITTFVNNIIRDVSFMEPNICQNGFCTFPASPAAGKVQFGIQFTFQSAETSAMTMTEVFDMGTQDKVPATTVMILLAAAFLFGWFGTRKLKEYMKRRVLAMPPTKVLLVHSATTGPHLRVVEALADYLDNYTYLTSLLDVRDIPNHPSQDALVWCDKATKEADIICVVASPYQRKLRENASTYNADETFLGILRQQYESRSVCYRDTAFCVLTLPYTTSEDIPAEASMLRRIKFPDQLDQLLLLKVFNWPVPSVLVPSISGGSCDFPLLADVLMLRMAAAALDLQNNRAMYLEMIADPVSQKTVTFPSASNSEDLQEVVTEGRRGQSEPKPMQTELMTAEQQPVLIFTPHESTQAGDDVNDEGSNSESLEGDKRTVLISPVSHQSSPSLFVLPRLRSVEISFVNFPKEHSAAKEWEKPLKSEVPEGQERAKKAESLENLPASDPPNLRPYWETPRRVHNHDDSPPRLTPFYLEPYRSDGVLIISPWQVSGHNAQATPQNQHSERTKTHSASRKRKRDVPSFTSKRYKRVSSSVGPPSVRSNPPTRKNARGKFWPNLVNEGLAKIDEVEENTVSSSDKKESSSSGTGGAIRVGDTAVLKGETDPTFTTSSVELAAPASNDGDVAVESAEGLMEKFPKNNDVKSLKAIIQASLLNLGLELKE